MGAKGICIAEECHIVNLLPPIDITGGQWTDVFNMEGYSHATIIIQAGVTAAAWTKIIVNECIDATGHSGTATAIAHSIYKCETASSDVLGARTAVLAAGTTPSANNNIFYVIELDAAELTSGYNWVEISLTDAGNANLVSAVAILSGARYGMDQSPTVLA